MTTGLAKEKRERLMYRVVKRFDRRFFLYLAVFASLLVAVDVSTTKLVGGMEQATFDWLMKHRIHYAAPDRDIVIVDIDDASIKELSLRYGRWPWPREVIGGLLEKLAVAKPRAIVFDIAFSEPDKLNPVSDQHFLEQLRKSGNVFFPMVLLDETGVSSIPLRSLASAKRLSATALDSEKTSVLLPFFHDELKPTQIGTNNITPDKDGIIRRFAPQRETNGWGIPSIALQVARSLNFPPLQNPNFLVNWRGPPYSYSSASFSHILSSPIEGPDSHLKEDFGGKIVIIGSTAASLFDIKASPMARIHPGVEMLATVVDNIKNNDPLHELPSSVYAFAAIAFIFVLAFTLYSERSAMVTDWLFILLQFVAIGVCYLLLNLGNTYLDMTVPIAFSVGFFTVARIYGYYLSEYRAMQISPDIKLQYGSRYRLSVMAIRFASGNTVSRKKIEQLLRKTLASSELKANVEMHPFGSSRLLENLVPNLFLISWITIEDVTTDAKIEMETYRITGFLRNTYDEKHFTTSTESGTLIVDEQANVIQGQDIAMAAINSITSPR